jgi:hypothetical protein
MSTPIVLTLTVADPIPLTLTTTPPIYVEAEGEPTFPEADPIFQAWQATNPLADFLTVTARLGEFDTSQKKVDARNNLELQIIDLGTF